MTPYLAALDRRRRRAPRRVDRQHLIVPYPPGGGTDIVGRLLGEKLSATALYLGRRRNSYVEGLTPSPDALLDELWQFADSPQFFYEHRWRVGDLVLWDNRSTMHRRDPFDNAARRVMHRTQIKGKWQPSAYVEAA